MQFVKPTGILVTFFFIILYFLCGIELYAHDTIQYRYFVGTSEPDTNWKEKEFNDSLWMDGHGSIGYGDNDDTIVIEKTTSLYIRYC
jgi:hypothetical protein